LAVAQQCGDQRGLAHPRRADQPDAEDELAGAAVVGRVHAFSSSGETRPGDDRDTRRPGVWSRSPPPVNVAIRASRARAPVATRAFAASISPNTPGQISSRYE